MSVESKPPYSALTIAEWFVAYARGNEAELSNLKLQKLLYYAQGSHLGAGQGPLFNDAICAWVHGPVVQDVYHAYKKFGSGDICDGPEDDFDWDAVDPVSTDMLIDVWEEFGSIAAWRLRNMTHAEPPWREHFEANARGVEIPVESMQKYFADRAAAAAR